MQIYSFATTSPTPTTFFNYLLLYTHNLHTIYSPSTTSAPYTIHSTCASTTCGSHMGHVWGPLVGTLFKASAYVKGIFGD